MGMTNSATETEMQATAKQITVEYTDTGAQIVTVGDDRAIFARVGDGNFRLSLAERRFGPNSLAWAIYDASGNLVSQGKDWVTSPTPEMLASWDRLAGVIAARIRGKRPISDQLYIRFGRLPKGGRSRNHATGQMEAGVSVYGGDYDPIADAYRYSEDGTCGGAIIAYTLRGVRPYLVTGDLVGRGSDGEPVIANARILGTLHYSPDLRGFRLRRRRPHS